MSTSFPLDRAKELLASEGPRAAIEHLTAVNRERPDAAIERELLRLRQLAHEARVREAVVGRPEALEAAFRAQLDAAADPFPEARGIPPEVDASRLNVETLRGAIKHHGCLIVRGFMTTDRAERMDHYTKLALATASKHIEDPDAPIDEWYAPYDDPRMADSGRAWCRTIRTLFAGDCPRAFFELLEAFRDVGFDRIASEYFGEPAVVSVQKSAVREVTPRLLRGRSGTIWHQDRRILGAGKRALNVWIAFTDAGASRPGLDVVPRRFEQLVPTGTGAALFDWCVGEDTILELAGDTPPVSPVFAPGDAILFDDLFLHAGSVKEGMNEVRASSETWFFPESDVPEGYLVALAI